MDINLLAESILKAVRTEGAENLPDTPALTKRLSEDKTIVALCEADDENVRRLSELYSRLLLTLARLVDRPQGSPISKAMESIKKMVGHDAAGAELEKVSNEIKNAVIQEQLSGDPIEKPGAPTPVTASELMVLIKETYIALIATINMDLGQDYKKRLAATRKRVVLEETPIGLIHLRPELEEIVREFASNVFEGQSRANQFILEVAKHLADLEQYMTLSLGHLKIGHDSNHKFNTRLSEEVRDTVAIVKEGQGSGEFSQAIVAKLKKINQIIMDKVKTDKEIVKSAKQDMDDFNTRITDFHGEVDRVREENKELLRKLQTDSLTGVFNRHYYDTACGEACARFSRYQRPFSLIVFDLDRFKTINDTYGHHVGDRCLIELASTVSSTLRQSDSLMRYGGDEFVILLPETDSEQAATVAEKIRALVESTVFTVNDNPIPVTISVGVSGTRPTDTVHTTVFQRADKALYQSKQNGRNRVSAL